MPSTVETPEGYEVVPGRSQKKALTLLRIAEELGHDVHAVSVRPRSDEYLVPKDVADKFRAEGEDDVEENLVAPSRDGSESRWVPNEDIEEERKTLPSGTEDADGDKAIEEQESRSEETDESDKTGEDDDDKSENPKPAKSQSKQDWFDYAKSKGFEGDIDSVTKEALIEKYGDA
jgi:hypothetical protein